MRCQYLTNFQGKLMVGSVGGVVLCCRVQMMKDEGE